MRIFLLYHIVLRWSLQPKFDCCIKRQIPKKKKKKRKKKKKKKRKKEKKKERKKKKKKNRILNDHNKDSIEINNIHTYHQLKNDNKNKSKNNQQAE